jgi:uncharacterized protein (TIGR00645 family)
MRQIERGIEAVIYNSRWIMAPFYVGLAIGLLVLLFKFAVMLFDFVRLAAGQSEAEIILGVLSLVDLSLTGNLVLIVIFSGYENFVSKIDSEQHPDWPDWMAKVDFAGLKQKLLASIVAISAIQVLKAFMNIDQYHDPAKLGWLVGIHIVFVVSTLVLAFADRLSERTETHPEHKRPTKR